MRETQEEIDREVIEVMVNGGRFLCGRAIDNWHRGAYLTGQQDIDDNVDRWKRIRAAIGDMRTTLRANAKRQTELQEGKGTDV